MYVPLRVHGHHSMLTGVDAPATLLERARELGLPALALADVDTLAGLVEFLQAAQREPVDSGSRVAPIVAPIVAAEISDPSGAPGRLIALVESERGYANLCRLVSARQLGGDPGERGACLDGPEHFRLIEAAVRHQEGLIFLVDHPRLALALAGRVDARSLCIAVSPASLALSRRRRREPRVRNVAAAGAAPLDDPEERAARRDGARYGLAAAARDAEDELEHPKTPAPERPVPAHELVDVARATGLALVAVPDTWCAHAAGFADHRLRVAIKHNALAADLPESWLAAAPAQLLSPAEMAVLYADLPEVPGPFEHAEGGALARTLALAERCRFAPVLGGILFPKIELPAGQTAYSELVARAFDGARQRYRPLKPEVVRRLDHELTTIERLGFAPYFLLVQQIADFARERRIPCVGRGSAADSLVAYCLRLTDADPLRYRLIFERFLNPARRDRPDIDLDFCWRRRDEVLTHVYQLFGSERTAMISTLNRCGLRAAFREAALVEGLPPAEVNRWSRRLPYYFSNPAADDEVQESVLDPRQSELGLAAPPKPTRQRARLPGAPVLDAALAANPIARILAETPEAAGFPFADARFARVLQLAARLVDTPRHHGLHPGGVVVAPGAITEVVACQRAKKGVIVTQLDKDAVEAIGLVKMDLLGNRALTTLDDCLTLLRERGVEPDLEALPEDDPATALTLKEGRTVGCFQVESPGMRNLLQQIGARTMDDVIQSVALIRPGPAGSGMKDAYVRRFNKVERPTPPHPRLSELLWDTQGVMLYQEDVMQAAALVAGLDLAEADLLRRALQKHRAHELGPLCERFLAGAAEQGIARADALRVWDLIANFASFGFCKAHAVTYGRIAYRAVWLKTHHPAEYLASFLASETGYYDARVYVEEARRLGVAILGPDVNQSAASFTVERPAGRAASRPALRPALRIGLSQVKGLSQRTLEALLATRAAHGAFVSLPDFLERSGAHTDECERLIQTGACDAFDRTRPELLWRLHLLRTPARKPLAGTRAEEHGALDARLLADCQATPRSREHDALAAARARSGGWRGSGLALGRLELEPGQSLTLFPEPAAESLALPRLPDHDARTRGVIEYELLGLTIASHPVELFPCPADERLGRALFEARGRGTRAAARPPNPIACGELARFQGGRVTLRGWPAATRHVRTADQRSMRFLTLEDASGLAEVVVFPDVYERDGAQLAQFGVLCVTGLVENQLGATTLHAERIW